jgi:hypothetical protein
MRFPRFSLTRPTVLDAELEGHRRTKGRRRAPTLNTCHAVLRRAPPEWHIIGGAARGADNSRRCRTPAARLVQVASISIN